MSEGILPYLARAAKEAREDADRLQVHIAAELSVGQSTVARFEKGERWPADPDLMLDAYARDLSIDVRELWAAALKMWEESPERAIDQAADEIGREPGRGGSKGHAADRRRASG